MRNFFSSLSVVAALACLTMTSASAQDDDATKERLKRQNRANAVASSSAGKLDGKTSGHSIRASQLIGMNIENPQGESVGEINDLVLDTDNGKVRYAAVTYGGFLGLGDKMFAVPFEAFQCKQDPDDRDDYILVLDVTKQKLEGAQGFDQDHWPNFADRTFTSDLDRRYGVDRRTNRERLRGGRVDVDIDREGVDVDVDRDAGDDRDE